MASPQMRVEHTCGYRWANQHKHKEQQFHVHEFLQHIHDKHIRIQIMTTYTDDLQDLKANRRHLLEHEWTPENTYIQIMEH